MSAKKYFMYLCGGARIVFIKICAGKSLKLNGIRYYVGRNVKIWLHNGGICNLGRKNWLSDGTRLQADGGEIILGYNNFFNTNCQITALDEVIIGDNNLFGNNVVIVDHDHRFENPNELICKQGYNKSKVIIGSDIWIGANVTICKGVKISDKVVVGANSVVTKSIEEPGVYVGCPARKI